MDSKNLFPPEIEPLEKWILYPSYVMALIPLVFLIDQFCFGKLFLSSLCLTYIALAFLGAVLIIDRVIRHKIVEHNARLEDRSEVEAMFVEAETVQPRLIEPRKLPEDFERLKDDLQREVIRLKELGPKGWTDYQVLSISQMLIDFWKVDDLKAQVQSLLADLGEYAEDSAYRMDWQQYNRWEVRINEAIDEIDKIKEKKEDIENREEKQDDAAERLRAETRSLLEYVASYKANWAEGSAVVRALTIVGVAILPVLLAMGVLPLIHPGICEKNLSIFNWGLLGIAGANTGVLLSLRKSDLVEVGNTEGKKEVRRAILGVGLGLVAGILLYSMIAGELMKGSMFFPNLELPMLRDKGLSIFWGIVSGFSFEWVFERIRSTTEKT
jgi:hypothetical protein